MPKITWDEIGEHFYETGVDQGVLFPVDTSTGEYQKGVPWNGLTGVEESPTGAESNKQYADNIPYLNLVSTEEFEATLKAFTYPDEFAACDGSAIVEAGFLAGQQTRKPFGFAYRTLEGNDVAGTDYGYNIHVVYGCLASPSSKSYETVNNDPSAIEFSWSIKSTPVKFEGFKPVSTLVFNSVDLGETKMTAIENALYGTDGSGSTAGTDPYLPLPDDFVDLLKNL